MLAADTMHALETQAIRPPAGLKGGISHEENSGIRTQCGARHRCCIDDICGGESVQLISCFHTQIPQISVCGIFLYKENHALVAWLERA